MNLFGFQDTVEEIYREVGLRKLTYEPPIAMYVVYRRPRILGLDRMILELFFRNFPRYQQYSRYFGKTVVLYGDTDTVARRLENKSDFVFDQHKLITILPSNNKIFRGYTKILETKRFDVGKYLSQLNLPATSKTPFEVCFNSKLQLSLGLFTVSLAHLLDELVSLNPENSKNCLSQRIRYETLPAEEILSEYQLRKENEAIIRLLSVFGSVNDLSQPLFSVRLYGGKSEISEIKPKTVLGCVRCYI